MKPVSKIMEDVKKLDFEDLELFKEKFDSLYAYTVARGKAKHFTEDIKLLKTLSENVAKNMAIEIVRRTIKSDYKGKLRYWVILEETILLEVVDKFRDKLLLDITMQTVGDEELYERMKRWEVNVFNEGDWNK